MRITGSVPIDPNDRFTQRIKSLEQQVAELQRNPVAAFAHSVMALRSTTQSINNATSTAISFTGTDEYDTDSIHDPAVNASRLTIPAGLGGKWLVGYSSIRWASAAGDRVIWLAKNGGATRYAEHTSVGGGFAVQQGSSPMSLAAGDYAEVFVFQNSGAALNVDGSSFPLRFWATYLGR